MKTLIATVASLTALLTFSSSSRADDATTPTPRADPFRVDVAVSAGTAFMNRSRSTPDAETGYGLGVDLHVSPFSHHGFFGGYLTSGSIFGPSVSVVDTGYSFGVFDPGPLKGVSPILYFDVGPALGFVDIPNQGKHHVLGTRLGAALGFRVWNGTLGVTGSYRSGFPLDSGLPDKLESVATFGVRAGFVFDAVPAAETRSVARSANGPRLY